MHKILFIALIAWTPRIVFNLRHISHEKVQLFTYKRIIIIGLVSELYIFSVIMYITHVVFVLI